jgi:hypothetical protein
MGSVHTSSVPELLGKTGFSLLMSTYQSGKMVTLREMEGVLNTSEPAGTGALSIGTRDEVGTYRDQPQGWRDTKSFGGLVMDVDSNEVITTGLCTPHSPRWYRDQLFVPESSKGTLSRVDLESGQTETITKLSGFTHGLAFIGRYAIVGLSQVRESVVAGRPLTQTNEPRHSGVWIVDLDTGEIVGFVRFDGLVQEVFDLQVIVGSGAVIENDGKPVDRHVHPMELENELHNKSFVAPTEALSGGETKQIGVRPDFATRLDGQPTCREAVSHE